MEACGEDGPASVASEIRALQVLRDTAMQALKSQVEQLAAENAALKNVFGPGDSVLNFLTIALRHTTYDQIDLDDVTLAFKMSLPETPATDRIVAGIKADGRVEGINFAASRLAAAFNHGFVDKPMAEVGDVVRMILDAKADLANSPIPPEDGLSGEYAEKSLAEWEAALREGDDKC
ncbi:hypothetical protein ACRZET_002592 [Klebsiella michiganensis]